MEEIESKKSPEHPSDNAFNDKNDDEEEEKPRPKSEEKIDELENGEEDNFQDDEDIYLQD